MNFSNHLRSKGKHKETIRIYVQYADHYLAWLNKERIAEEDIRYSDIMRYMASWQEHQTGISKQNVVLVAIRHYYRYKGHPYCPAEGIIIRGKVSKVISLPLSIQELESCYGSYPSQTPSQYRNKVILGLIIYQGLSLKDIEVLRPEDIDHSSGQIHIPSTSSSNARTLPLHASQMLALHMYVNLYRAYIQRKIEANNKHYKDSREAELLIQADKGGKQHKNLLISLFKAIKKTHPSIKDASQVRRAVIAEWLRKEGVRQVQYKTGHKTIRAVERHSVNSLENLKQHLDKYHPLG